MNKDEYDAKLVRTKWGFYQFTPLPGDADLREYYEKKYYQEGRGSYEISYTKDEIKYFNLKSSMQFRKSSELFKQNPASFLDIGCGEGWLMEQFHQSGCRVLGIDFSKIGIEKHHSHLLPFFRQGNVFDRIKKLKTQGRTFDIISICNVLEHVRDPVMMLEQIRLLMHSDSLLIITAPNDFSPLHDYLLANRIVDKKWWVVYPDHLSYFNKESMCNLLEDLQFDLKCIVADNPIDSNLLNENSNYVRDTDKGKNTHYFRVRMDNFLGSLDPNKLLAIYTTLGSMGVGRNLNYYVSLKS